jgi:hypothetical protein
MELNKQFTDSDGAKLTMHPYSPASPLEQI